MFLGLLFLANIDIMVNLIYSARMNLKRAFDIAFSSIGLIVTAPVTLCSCFAMAAVNKSFPIYKQTRIGKDRKPFTIYKVKSMRDDVDSDGKPLSDEERTSTVGKIIRKTRIDEFPQFFNVLKGDMSVVGPRPAPTYSPLSADKKRFSVKPGLTGLAQVAGKNSLTASEILKLDHTYVDKHSIIFDLKICALTPTVGLINNLKASHFREDAQSSSSQTIEP